MSSRFAACNAVYRRCRGAYAVVALIIGHGVLGFRDPNGIRPLVLGQRATAKGTEYMLASESVALDMLGFREVRDIAPGEAVFIDEAGRLHAQQCVSTTRHTPCIFEFVYFARPDSIIDNRSLIISSSCVGRKACSSSFSRCQPMPGAALQIRHHNRCCSGRGSGRGGRDAVSKAGDGAAGHLARAHTGAQPSARR